VQTRAETAPKKQQKQLPKTGAPTSLFMLGADVLLVSGGALARNLAK
jgi:LPXTG-motif cell wall-anchored protein